MHIVEYRITFENGTFEYCYTLVNAISELAKMVKEVKAGFWYADFDIVEVKFTDAVFVQGYENNDANYDNAKKIFDNYLNVIYPV